MERTDMIRAALWRAIALTLADPRFHLSETQDLILVAKHVDWMLSDPVVPVLRTLLKREEDAGA
jgi:hypothetical protein